MITVFFLKNCFDRADIFLRQNMAVSRDARSPLAWKKMTSRLVIDDTNSKEKGTVFVIIRSTLYLLSLYLLYIFII
jgi:hypothetical protein